MKKSTISNAARLLLIVFSVLSAFGCEINQAQNQDFPTDAPLSEFIIGRWEYKGEYYFEGYGSAKIDWEYTFVDDKVIKIRTAEDSGTCSYQFIEPNVMSIDCSPRMLDLMTWSVKRDDQFLLIQRSGGEELRFERVTNR